jgi:hypothetical protein
MAWWILLLTIGWCVAFVFGFAAGLCVAIIEQQRGVKLGTKVYSPTEQP